MSDDPPLVIMEVAFETDPLTRPGEGDWTDVTDAGADSVGMVSLETLRGARILTGQPVTGSATALVHHPNRVLEPFYAGSPWYPNVDLKKRVRWSVVLPETLPSSDISDGGDADPALPDVSDGGGADPPEADVSEGGSSGAPTVIWTGFLTRLPNAWSQELAQVKVDAEGLLALVNNVKLPQSVLEAVLAELGPIGLWLLADSGGTVATERVANRSGTYALKPTTVTPGVVPWGSIASQSMTPATDTGVGQSISISPLPAGTGTDRTLAVWFRIPSVPGSHADVPIWYATAGTNEWRMAVQDGRLTVEATDGTDGTLIVTLAQSLDDGQPHLAVMRIDTAGDTVDVRVDGSTVPLLGTFVTGTADYGAIVTALTSAKFGYDVAATALAGTDVRAYELGPVSLFDRVLTDAEVAAIWSAGVDAWAGDLTGARAHRILDLAGVDPADRDIDTGTQICGPAVLEGQTVGVYLRKIAQTEGGPIYETPGGEIALRERTPNNPPIDLVLSDDPAGDGGTQYEPLALDYGKNRLVNTANVKRPGSGSDQVVADAASVLKYGPSPLDVDTLHGTPTGALLVGARVVIRNKRPRLAIDGVTVSSLHRDEVDPTVSLDTDIGAVASFFARPPGGGDPIEQLLVVESLGQQFARDRWATTFGVFEHVVLPCFAWDDPDAGWDDTAWCEGGV